MISPQNVSTASRSRLLAEVPPFRPVAVQLMKLVGDPGQPLGRIVSLLRTDAVLAAEVLRVANSPLFGCRSEIRNILQALSFLGLARINALIVTTAMRALVDMRRSPLTHSCWRHNLATALICERLSATARLSQEECYIAGLLHDIGRLAMLRAFPEYERAMLEAEAEGQDLLTAEREHFGMDHGEAGRWLLCQWGCPLELQNVAARHESPPTTQTLDRNLICLVRAGSQLADLMKMSVFPSDGSAELPEIAGALWEAPRHEILAKFPDIAEWVVMRVNGIELTLL